MVSLERGGDRTEDARAVDDDVEVVETRRRGGDRGGDAVRSLSTSIAPVSAAPVSSGQCAVARSRAATWMPSSLSRRTMDAPMPLDAPTTIAPRGAGVLVIIDSSQTSLFVGVRKYMRTG